ncbi:DUF2755 family protein, partial [Pseudomonas aeruginosa]
MADFTLSKSLFSGKYRNASSTPGNIAYALFVLFKSEAKRARKTIRH